MMINSYRDWLQLSATLTEIDGGWGGCKTWSFSATATNASEILFQEKVSEKEHIWEYLFWTDILGRYVCFVQCFLRN